MELIQTAIPDVLILKPKVFQDARGFFVETFNAHTLQLLGLETPFVQDNHSRSSKNVLRGLHYQLHNPQGKLVRVTKGEVFDVAVDLRKGSATFGKSVGMVLSEENFQMAWIPPGFAHGFYVLSDLADVMYKVTTPYHQASDRSIVWSDPELKINWPLKAIPNVSEKDARGKLFIEADVFEEI